MTPAKNFFPVSTTPAINPCHGFSVIAGVVDTGNKFITGVRDTGLKFIPRKKLKGINRRYLRPPKSAMAADGVIGTAMKSCIHKHPTHLDQRPEAIKTK